MSRRIRQGLTVLALALPVALGMAAPAVAADEIAIDHVESKGGRVSLVLSTDGLPAGATAQPDDVTVDVDGRTVDADVKVVSAGDISRTTVLVLDASNSMKQAGKFEAATTAVNAFLDAAPADVEIGLVTFAGQIAESIAPTTDHEVLRSALAEVTLAKGTSVYDGILEGVGAAGTSGSRSVLVLSDGADTGSDTTLDVTSGTARDAGVVVDVVSLASTSRADELASLAELTGGSVIPADPAALSSVFTDRADALAQQLLVTFEAPAGTSEEASIDVAVTAGDATFHDSAFVTLTDVAELPAVVDSGKALVGKPVMLIGAVALALGLAGLLVTALMGATDTRSQSARRLDDYLDAGGAPTQGKRKSQEKADLKGSAVALADRMVTTDLETRISMRLAGAGSALTASEWLLLHAAIAIGAAFIGFVLYGGPFALFALIGGIVLPWIYLKHRHSRRLNAFNGQLAETLGLMAGGLQAGLSFPQAVDSVVREGNQPMAGELRRALVEQRLGIDITDALDSVSKRMESDDFGWVVMAIRIQREVGGNLAEILHTVADTLREREYLRRQVKALSAEGRLSGYILTGLPILIAVYMYFTNREYLSLLYTTTPGYFLLAGFIGLLSMGSFAMAKLAKVEV
ncbi:VWA domain-containing protein [Nocardioides seonyuensis]|uniref:VWA domain-containing protein n=1 Tax=Nocardioides seonyuensis TaxID=2518371 RepID=A0A4P7IC50_9ACTN|nr:type II secretion system F family protein [Nocardioides seonyuensis]QBX54083.1 VWA domain-containing protein [Nocardioides seonyuensis]